MAEPSDSPNVLIEALPPATDYITYLTLLEYNLKRDDLNLLNDILQDETLTINIGWDLVFLLIPLLPEAEPCLHTIARLGNPREVLLKVTEALRCIDFESDAIREEAEQVPDGTDTEQAARGAIDERTDHDIEPYRVSAEKSLPCMQFKLLLSMLTVLHRRIKTKYPSRFIATTLQGVLAAFANANRYHEPMLQSIFDFTRQILPSSRPELPPRTSETHALTTQESIPGKDPEGQAEVPSQGELRITKRLLQGFLTHVVEAYLLALSTDPDVVGLAWSSRVFEIVQPHKTIPDRKTMTERFSEEEMLTYRETSIHALTEVVGQELGLDFDDLINAALAVDQSNSKADGFEEDPPQSEEDIPLSKNGALFLLTAIAVRRTLIADHPNKSIFDKATLELDLFPTQLNLAQAVIGTEEAGGLNTAGSEPSALLDTILALGLIALHKGSIGEPESDEQFAQYLQIITLISANSPEPQLRFHAHYLATSVLRTHPSDVYRLAFIRDTLEHCPIENLKASAVSWIKGEVMEANYGGRLSEGGRTDSVFSTPVCLQTLGPFLFPDLSLVLGSSDMVDNWTTFKMNLSFWLAVLNFYYLLLWSRWLKTPLRVAELHVDNDIGGSMIGPLRQKSKEFRKSLKEGGELAEAEGEQGIVAAISDLDILDDVLDRVEQGVIELNKA